MNESVVAFLREFQSVMLGRPVAGIGHLDTVIGVTNSSVRVRSSKGVCFDFSVSEVEESK